MKGLQSGGVSTDYAQKLIASYNCKVPVTIHIFEKCAPNDFGLTKNLNGLDEMVMWSEGFTKR